MLLTPLRVIYIFTGEYDRAEVEPPVLPLRQYEQSARQIHDQAGRPTDWPDPRGVAIEWGWRVVPMKAGRASTTGETIFYRASAQPRMRGLMVWHEIAHCYLREAYPDCGEADAWLLTGALVLSWRHAKMPREWAIDRQSHAPDWFLDARRDYVLWHSTLPAIWAAE